MTTERRAMYGFLLLNVLFWTMFLLTLLSGGRS